MKRDDTLSRSFSTGTGSQASDEHSTSLLYSPGRWLEQKAARLKQEVQLRYEEVPRAGLCHHRDLHEVIKRGNEPELRQRLQSMSQAIDLDAACCVNDPCSLLYRAVITAARIGDASIVGTLLEFGGNRQLLVRCVPTETVEKTLIGRYASFGVKAVQVGMTGNLDAGRSTRRHQWTPYTRAAVGPLPQSWNDQPEGPERESIFIDIFGGMATVKAGGGGGGGRGRSSRRVAIGKVSARRVF